MKKIFYNNETINIIKPYLAKNRNKNYIEVSEDIVNNKKILMNPFIFIIDENIEEEWTNTEKYSRALLRLLNGFSFLGDLIAAYIETEDIKYLKKCTEIVGKWSQVISYDKHKDTMAYHDETTAMRMEYFLSLLVNGIKNLDEKEIEMIIKEIKFMAELLASDEFHTEKTNHGMFQDLALLKYAIIMKNDIKSEKYIRIANTRLKEYFDFVYTSEGVHKEHSPAYHMMVSANLKRYLNLLKAVNLQSNLSSDINMLLKKAEEYIIYITRPDGCIPNISDTEKKRLDSIYPNLFSSQQYKFALTSGKEGKPPSEKSKVFKESGYAIFRDDWSKKEKAAQVIFTAAYHAGYHKHTDDLNVLFYDEEDILVESGPNGYNYKDPFTKYAYSSRSHNTLTVVNKQLPRTDGKFDKVKILDYKLCDEYSEVIGENDRYEDVNHKRKVIFYNDTKVLEIEDYIESNVENLYELNWNFANHLDLKIDGDLVKIFRGNEEIGLVKIFSNKPFKIQIFKGVEKNGIKGWGFSKMESKEPIPNLTVTFNSRNAKFNTQIILYKNINKENIKNLLIKEQVYCGEENIKYIYDKVESSSRLCIVFPAMSLKNKSAYNYTETLKNCNINKLFLLDNFDVQGSYMLGKERKFTIESAVNSLIDKIVAESGIKYEDIVMIGSSKGGYTALYYGIKRKIGNIIVGGPQSKIGNFLLDEAEHKEVAKYISGGINEECKAYLNKLLYEVIESSNNSQSKVRIHVSKNDHHYNGHVKPLINWLEEVNIRYELELMDYKGHKKLKEYFPIYLLTELNKIDSSIISIDRIPKLDIRTIIEYKIFNEKNKIILNIINPNKKSKYAYYMFKDDECIIKTGYSNKTQFESEILDSGKYRIRIFEMLSNRDRKSIYTEYVNI